MRTISREHFRSVSICIQHTPTTHTFIGIMPVCCIPWVSSLRPSLPVKQSWQRLTADKQVMKLPADVMLRFISDKFMKLEKNSMKQKDTTSYASSSRKKSERLNQDTICFP